MEIYIVGAVVLLILFYILISYNGFVKSNNTVKEAFATMDVYLKKRWDLIPNIVETVKGYSQHEKDTLEGVVKLRHTAYSSMSQNEKVEADNQITGVLSKLMALSENYPDLKASQNFMELSGQLARSEEDIANARKYYNAVVKDFNNKIQMFPSNIIGKIFGFKEMKMFETSETEKENIKVRF